MITYNTKVIEYRRSPAIVISDAAIIPTSQDAHDAVNNNAFGKWKVYTGPAERFGHGPYGESGVGLKVCHNTNNWPCMIVRQAKEASY